MTCSVSALAHWQNARVSTPAGDVLAVATKLGLRDRLGHWRVRWGIRRGTHRVSPGLYAVGSANARSPILVTANYKMSFDRVRSQLGGQDAWILVLDTKGVNVWCAAGKGTFGTEELMRRVKTARLAEIVSHRKLVLPQLSATGVSAHQVRERSGWRVLYGPVRAEDLPAFLKSGMRATAEMRRVRFSLISRLVLVPVDLVYSAGYFLAAATALLLLSGLGADGYSFGNLREAGPRNVLLLFSTFLAGVAVAPALLPWLPGRAFSLKGLWMGLVAVVAILVWAPAAVGPFESWTEVSGWLLLGPAISSFLTMNFTGSSTYTSLSGVRREMRFAVPAQLTAAVIGAVVWLAGRFI